MISNNSLIELQDVSKIYEIAKQNAVTAVEKASLRVNEDEFVIITGRSGSGKTTLLNLISGLTCPTEGKVLLEGIDISKLSDDQQSRLRNQKIGFVFQFPSLIPSLTSLENVILPTLPQKNPDQQAIRERAMSLLEEVGLTDKTNAYPRQLSAGQQQRVVVARALINRPALLLADEPTSNLDEQTEQEIMTLIQQLHRERPITILLVTHSAELRVFGNRSVRMAEGKIV